MMTIRRNFADLSHGQVHYRDVGGGDATPLLILHGSPGSGRQMLSLVADMAATRRVIAPDTPGHGDSVVLGIETPEIADYARALPGLLDALGLARVDVYGTHTGASIAAELAIHAPQRVGRVILDGIGVFEGALRTELLDRYAHPFVPDVDGAYLMRAWHFLRDQYLFFPWYDRRREARRDAGLRPPGELHAWLVEVLKAAETYHLAYRAAFRWVAEDAMPMVTHPTQVCCAADDPLFAGTQTVAGLLPDGRFAGLPRYDAPDFGRARRALFEGFLA